MKGKAQGEGISFLRTAPRASNDVCRWALNCEIEGPLKTGHVGTSFRKETLKGIQAFFSLEKTHIMCPNFKDHHPESGKVVGVLSLGFLDV